LFFLFSRDLRRWINQERGIYSSSNGDSDNANEYIKRREQAHLHHHHYPQQRRRTITYHGGTSQPPTNTRQPTILQKLFGVDHQTSSFSKYFNDKKKTNFFVFFCYSFFISS
jgi:hypothetical protein